MICSVDGERSRQKLNSAVKVRVVRERSMIAILSVEIHHPSSISHLLHSILRFSKALPERSFDRKRKKRYTLLTVSTLFAIMSCRDRARASKHE